MFLIGGAVVGFAVGRCHNADAKFDAYRDGLKDARPYISNIHCCEPCADGGAP